MGFLFLKVQVVQFSIARLIRCKLFDFSLITNGFIAFFFFYCLRQIILVFIVFYQKKASVEILIQHSTM
ncbi:hypothetical protein DRI50_04625 [candidate division KSB1 bacterium]|nr:MAG: hypothetical protein DRI50_04625 [candidate division KSB1 bacterium]